MGEELMIRLCVFVVFWGLIFFILQLFFALKKTIIEAIEIKKEEALIKKCKKIQEIPKDIAIYFNNNSFGVYFIRFLKIHNLYGEYVKKFSRYNKSKILIFTYAEINSKDLCRCVPFYGDYKKWVTYDEIWRNIWVNYYNGLDIKKIKYNDFSFRYLDKETFEKEKKLVKKVLYEHLLRVKKLNEQND